MNKFIAAEAAECIGCHACEIACAMAHNQENWPLSHSDFRPRIHVVGKGQAANPVACHHCNNAPCVTACPVNALTFQPDSVQLDEQKCIGCKRCAIACPFGVVEMVDTIAQKCDLCNQRSSGTQACIEVCPTQALRLMDDKGLQQIKVARQRKTAAGKASSDAQPSRSAALLPVNSRKGADKISASERKTHFGEIYYGLDPQQATYESDRCVYCAEKLTATGIARCITLFRITSVWCRKERLLKRQNFATRPVPYQKSAAGYVHRTVFVKAHVL